ncbi:MAG TPA: ABC transporter permease [Pyrinomonadaceae bacterium]|nr:ABC transporter permease [Pyrinomonadaceae bacterium]
MLDQSLQSTKHKIDGDPLSPAFHRLPDEPLIVIEAGRSRFHLAWGEIWQHRELLYFMIWRDLKVRYKPTALGLPWVVLQPVLTTAVFTVFLGLLARVPSDNLPYPLLVFSGLLPWTFFANAVSNSSYSLISNAHIITKVYFPRLIIPAAVVGERVVDFGISFVILVAMMIFYGASIGPSLLMLVPLFLLLVLFSLGASFWAAAVNVKYRDIGIALPVLIQLGMFISPVVYPSTLVPERWRWLYLMNPVSGIIEGFRAALFGRDFDWLSLGVAAIFTAALVTYAAVAFMRMEEKFADVV